MSIQVYLNNYRLIEWCKYKLFTHTFWKYQNTVPVHYLRTIYPNQYWAITSCYANLFNWIQYFQYLSSWIWIWILSKEHLTFTYTVKSVDLPRKEKITILPKEKTYFPILSDFFLSPSSFFLSDTQSLMSTLQIPNFFHVILQQGWKSKDIFSKLCTILWGNFYVQ